MSANVLVLIWVQSAVLLGLAWVVCRLTKAAVVRQWVCRAGLVGAAALAMAAPLAAGRSKSIVAAPFKPIVVRVPAAAVPSPRPARQLVEQPLLQSVMHPIRQAALVAGARPAIPDPRRWDPAADIVVAWKLGSAIMALYTLIGLSLLLRLRLRSRPCTNSELVETAAVCGRKLGLRKLQVREVSGDGTPFVAGIVKPAVFVGCCWIEGQTAGTLEAFLCHEAAHVVRRDLAWQAFHRLVQVVLWPQPFVWLLGRAMSLAAEEMCDGHVIAAGTEPAAYADRLLRLAESSCSRTWSIRYGFGMAHSRSALGRRLEALVNATKAYEIRLSRRARLGLALSLFSVVALAAMVFATPQAGTTPAKGPRLDQSGVLSIRILAPDRKPVQQARVWLLYGRFFADDGGAEEIPFDNGIAKATYAPNHVAGAIVVESPGYGLSTSAHIKINVPEDQDFVLSSETRVVGRLLLPDGRPAAGIRVVPDALACHLGDVNPDVRFIDVFGSQERLHMRDRYATKTDRDGRFAIGGLPQRAGLDLNTDDVRFARSNGIYHMTGNSGLTVLPDIRLSPAATIEGRVLRGGEPVRGVVVRSYECFGYYQHGGSMKPTSPAYEAAATTDAAGRYRLERLNPGKYGFAVDLAKPLSDEVTAKAYNSVVVREGEHKTGYDFALVPGAVIKGQVTWDLGPLARNFRTYLEFAGRERPEFWSMCLVRVGSDGRYSVRVPAGRQTVYADDCAVRKQFVTVKEGEERTLNFVFTRYTVVKAPK